MDVGILGLTASGKSTLFKLLTGQEPAAAGGRRDSAQMGVARVPDVRLDVLTEMYNPAKTTPATVRYVDVPGIPEEHRHEAAFNLPELRATDVLMVVVRGFDSSSVAHPMGDVDPIRDLRHIEEEFILQDQLVVERRLERIDRDLAKRKNPDLVREREILVRCLAVLEASTPLRGESFSADEERILRGFTFLSHKPLLVVLNVGENDLAGDPFAAAAWQVWKDRQGIAFTWVCATLEGELAELEGDDAEAFMADLGLTESALDRVIRDSYHLLGLISFFTVGDDECRAWSIKAGTPAVEAGGVIHSDIQRGFIRAEVVPYEELIDAGSLATCRQRGSLRLEGKTYLVQDGEVVHFRFNV